MKLKTKTLYLEQSKVKEMSVTLHAQSVYSEILIHANLKLMTKITDYSSPAKQLAKIEAQICNAEVRVLRKAIISEQSTY